jgi:hypothetical protein
MVRDIIMLSSHRRIPQTQMKSTYGRCEDRREYATDPAGNDRKLRRLKSAPRSR